MFSVTLDKICNDIKDATDDHIRKTVGDIARSLNYKSPVGNASLWKYPAPAGYTGGHFRRNWQYGYGTRPTGEIEGTENDALHRIEMQIDASPAVGIHYITNNVPYAQRLEEGWSGQAPQGMISLVAMEFQ